MQNFEKKNPQNFFHSRANANAHHGAGTSAELALGGTRRPSRSQQKPGNGGTRKLKMSDMFRNQNLNH
jgi:hypothetical protein